MTETSSKFSNLEFKKQLLHTGLEQVMEKVKQGEALEKDLHRL